MYPLASYLFQPRFLAPVPPLLMGAASLLGLMAVTSAVPGWNPVGPGSSLANPVLGAEGTAPVLLEAHLVADGSTRLEVRLRGDWTPGDVRRDPVDVWVVQLPIGALPAAGSPAVTALRGALPLARRSGREGSRWSFPLPREVFEPGASLGVWAVRRGDRVLGGTWVGVGLPPFDPAEPRPTPPEPGSVLITEFMKNPAAVSDTRGEWVELHNPTATMVDIEGWTLRDDGSNDTVVTAAAPGAGVMIAPGGFVVLGRQADPALNGGVVLDATLTGFTLNNGADQIILEAPGGLPVDRVDYDDLAWPDEAGASAALSPRFVGTSVAADGAAWCSGTAALPGGDLGSPGAPNADCGG